MKALEIAKVFLYIFILMIAFVLLKGLSTFEFSMRDKSILYEDMYFDDYKSTDKSFLDRLKSKSQDGSNGEYLELSFKSGEYESLVIPIDTSFQFSSSDTGYIEVKLKTDIPHEVLSLLVWTDVNENTQVIADINPKIRGDQILKTDLLPLQSFQKLQVNFQKQLVKEDSVSIKQLDAKGVFLIDYVKFVKAIAQKEIF